MCCQISLQDRVRAIAILSIIFCIALTIFEYINWLVLEEHSMSNATNVSISCDAISKMDCNVSTEVNDDNNGIGIKVVLTIFQLLVDLPISVLLLIGAKTRTKQLLAPWMFLTAMKMLGYVIACCIFVQFILVHTLDEHLGFGMKHYSKPTNDTSEQHYSIFSGSAVDNVVHERCFQNYTFDI